MIRLFSPIFDVQGCLTNIKESLEEGWAGYGKKSTEFEKIWKQYTGFNYAVFLNSATAGLELSFESMKELYGWDNNDEVITTPLTFVATNHSIIRAKLKPVFADIDDTLCLDPESIEKNISSRTKAVIFVGIGGNIGNLYSVNEICKKNNLKLILDAAHMAGTKVYGNVIDNIADIAVYSFQSTKVLQTADSGMVCCNDERIIDKIRRKAWFGIDKTRTPWAERNIDKWYYDVVEVSGSLLGNDIMASIALEQFKHLGTDVVKRRRIALKYYEGLKEVKEISFIKIHEGCESAQWLFQIVVPERDKLMRYMMEQGIETGLHYLDNTEFSMYHYANGTCPVARYYSRHIVSIPLHLNLSDTDIQQIIEVIKTFYKGGLIE